MIRLLEWDTDFFELKTGSVNVGSLKELNYGELEKFDLVYVYTEVPEEIVAPSFFLADEKVTYSKKISKVPDAPDVSVISVLPTDELTDSLINLSYQAGEYSRFNRDPMLPESKFKELYKRWMINSVNRKLAKEVFAVRDKDIYKGMITLGIKNRVPDIGLVAVDQQYRGRGIGHKLMQAAEYWAVHIEKLDEIQVVTQGFNTSACAFYESNGYSLVSKQFIYHWWSPKSKR